MLRTGRSQPDICADQTALWACFTLIEVIRLFSQPLRDRDAVRGGAGRPCGPIAAKACGRSAGLSNGSCCTGSAAPGTTIDGMLQGMEYCSQPERLKRSYSHVTRRLDYRWRFSQKS